MGSRSEIVYRRNCEAGVDMRTGLPDLKAPRNQHVICKVICAGLNPVDAKYLIGDKCPEWIDALIGRRLVEGYGVGFDFSGVVEFAPEGCRFEVGDEVYGTTAIGSASLTNHCNVPIHQLCRKPRNLSFAEASSLPLVGLTCIQSLKPYFSVGSNLDASCERILIIGASGGVGHIGLQVAKSLGAKSITAICGPNGKNMVSSLNPQLHIIDYINDDVMKNLHELAEHEGRYDICLDTVTSKSTIDSSSGYKSKILGAQPKLISKKYITIGGQPIDWIRAGTKRLIGLNLFPQDCELFWIKFPHSSGDLKQLSEFIEAGKVKPYISREIPYDIMEIRRALNDIISRRVKGKIIVRLSPDP